ncbi:MAG: hypothetical protein Q9192_001167 [Flavoplaca navasiana]
MPHVNGSTEKSTKPSRERPGRPGGNTADLVKRRYSTRFVQPSDFNDTDAPPIPKLHLPDTGSIPSITVDKAALKDPNLDPEQYTATVLSDASDQQLRDYQTSLRKLKNGASTDLQQNVFQNRTQFIKISKDAEKLNEDMRTLRSHMSELSASVNNLWASTAIPEARSSLENAATRTRKQANRSSVANLEQIYNNQLQTLWKEVEGSQKFLPAIPGRHVEIEQRRWAELDAATWKSKQKVSLILLNDHLMVACEKSRNRVNPSSKEMLESAQKVPTRLVAEKCWPLQDIDMLDLAPMGSARDKHEMANAISIRCGQESFTYQSERSSSAEKDKMLRKFRQASEELRRLLRTETLTNTKNKKDKSDLSRSLSNDTDRSDILVDVDGKQKNLRWVEGQIDELDIEVALQHFEDAVRLVEKLRKITQGLKGNAIVQDLIATKIDGRAKMLADEHRMAGPPRTRRSSARILPQRQVRDDRQPSPSMYLRGRSEGLYLSSVFRILYRDEKYSQHIPAVLPTFDDERLCEMGEAAFGWLQRHSFKTTEQRTTGEPDVERMYGSSERARNDGQ